MRRSGQVGKAQRNPTPSYSIEQLPESLVTRTSLLFTALVHLLQKKRHEAREMDKIGKRSWLVGAQKGLTEDELVISCSMKL